MQATPTVEDIHRNARNMRAAQVECVPIDAAGCTHVGRVRERNEDQFLVATLERSLRIRSSSVGYADGEWLPSSGTGTLLMVADGMGGMGGGDVASQVAVRAVTQHLWGAMPHFDAAPPTRKRQDSLPGVRDELTSAVAQGDQQVRTAAANGDAKTRKMGTTLTIAYINFPTLYVAHVGDSRCYLLRAGEIAQLTEDHTVAEQMRQDGRISVADDSEFHHVLHKALGGTDHALVDPQIRRVLLGEGDHVLLCSDGVTKHLSDTEIRDTLRGAPTAQHAADNLVAEANARGGTDNITAVVARCTPQ